MGPISVLATNNDRTAGRPATCDCGHCPKCKHREYMREWYRRKSPAERRAWIARKDKVLARERDRQRFQRDKPKRRALIASRDPAKQRAKRLVMKAKARGALVPPAACERCGQPRGDLQAHHEDYSRPLVVRWLCRPCHGLVHRKADHEFVGWSKGGEAHGSDR